ncbi:DUF961 family protein [Listeria welshimeri]|uniref:DUF961 family protein n=1 Tax=Listeria TaxID=1637 RepID=UPI00086F8523|nr:MULTISPECIES: DUF961 family protein [Listeria]EAC2497767.1 DUF961 domain-containing protein [Listeria monocytogenes]EAC8292099.1 DUF961 domain-containing protein [Listeria monocytogenes]EAD1488714.1 DUF961 domain-containing protein [Listeria monocytogenes]EAD2139064.1 DUF961 domain-containing protein [Listeria monocytogenes]EAF9811563.1 DUF961 domain-containing protein [Listeria monocytogenes]
MELKFIATTNETFENVRFAGHDATKDIKSGYSRSEKLEKRYFNLLSRDFPGGLEVYLPETAGEKEFAFNTKVKLVNPVMIPVANRIGNNNALVNWELHADDLVPFK